MRFSLCRLLTRCSIRAIGEAPVSIVRIYYDCNELKKDFVIRSTARRQKGWQSKYLLNYSMIIYRFYRTCYTCFLYSLVIRVMCDLSIIIITDQCAYISSIYSGPLCSPNVNRVSILVSKNNFLPPWFHFHYSARLG